MNGRLAIAGLCAVAVAGVAALAWADRAVTSTLSGAAFALDGDTVVVDRQTVRLFGIDAPELDQTCAHFSGSAAPVVTWPCGVRAKEALEKLINTSPVSCTKRDIDQYGRIVAVCKVGALDLGAEMVRAGWAVAFVRHSRDYVDEEQVARLTKSGIWQGPFLMPSVWRERRRERRDAR